MCAQNRARSVVIPKPQAAKALRRGFGVILLAGALAAVAGCGAVPLRPFVGPDPADPRVSVPAVEYRSTLGPYRSQRPAEPADWRGTDERVAPRSAR